MEIPDNIDERPPRKYAGHYLWMFLATVVSCQAQGIITTVAGGDLAYPGTSFSAFAASFGQLSGVAVSPVNGNVYFASRSRSLIVKYNPHLNSVSVVAGIGIGGYTGDGGPAAQAALNSPEQLAFDRAGDLYIADQLNGCVRKIDPQGLITTVVSNLGIPHGVAVAADGSLYVAEYTRVLRMTVDGKLSVVAGSQNGQVGYSGDRGPASSALLNYPQSLAFDGGGNLFVEDVGNSVVRKIDTNGIISTFAGNGQSGDLVEGPAIASPLQYFGGGMTVDSTGNLLIGIGNNLLKIDSKGTLSNLTTTHSGFFLTVAGRLADASISPSGMAFDQMGNLYFTDSFANCLYRSSPASIVQAVAAYAPNFGVGDGPALAAGLNGPRGLGVMPDGSLLIADSYNQRIRRLSPTGVVSTLAGNGSFGCNFPAMFNPFQAVSDSSGNVYIHTGCQIARIGASGSVSIINVSPGGGIAVDPQGGLLGAFASQPPGHSVQRVSLDGTLTPIAGSGPPGFSGDNGPATAAKLNGPTGLAVDPNGNVYIADTGNNRVRKVSPDGLISTIAGGGTSLGDGVVATQASIGPWAIACDRLGNVYIAEEFRGRVRKISLDGTISTIAGAGPLSFGGDGGPGTDALLNHPVGVAVDVGGNVYISDQLNNRIRKVLSTPPPLSVSSTQLTIAAFSGAAPVQTNVTVSSPVQGLSYSINFSTQNGGDWLGFSQLQGQAPGVLTIIADPSTLQPGAYQGTVTLNNPYASPQTLSISVTLQVGQAQPAKLAVGSQSLSFALTTSNNQSSTQLTVSNQGGGTLGFTASTTTATGGNWLQLSPQKGTASPSNPANLTVTAIRGNLTPGTYSGAITVASADAGQQITIPVTLAVNQSPQQILLSQTGMTFKAVAQGGSVLPQSLGILNIGSGSMTWTATATTLSGAGWLSLSATTGTVNRPFLDVSFIDIIVNAKLLAAGTYYGNVQVTAPGASNSPQAMVVVLNVLPQGLSPGPEVRPTGLIFTGVAGAANPGSQSITLANVMNIPITFGSSVTYLDAANWIKYLPANATVVPDSPAQIVVQPDFSSLGTGVRRAALTLLFNDDSIRTVSILSVIAPAGAVTVAGSGTSTERQASVCTPSKLFPVFEQLGTGSNVPAGWPVAVIAKVVDDCGAFITSGSVVASFSNGDPPLSLVNLQNGVWSSNWQPRNASIVGVTVTLTAQVPALSLTGLTQQTIGLQGIQILPLLSGVPVSAVTLTEGPLAPGELVLIKGSALANAQASSSSTPLPHQLAGASVVINGRFTPLLYADDGQLVGIVPLDLLVNSSQQIVPLRDAITGVPSPVIIAASQPAVFTKDGSGQGQALAYKAGVLADASHPVQAGDTVIIYCAGLGAVDSQGSVTNPVTVTIGGQPAQVSYAGADLKTSYPAEGPPVILGVSTGLGGLYQINAAIPNGIATGQAAINISSAGQSSQQGVTLSVSGSPVSPPSPRISAGGIVSGGLSLPPVKILTPNAIATVFGDTFAPGGTQRVVATTDLVNGRLPTILNGVCVYVNNVPSPLFFLSPTQINFQVPQVPPGGPIGVQVATSCGTPNEVRSSTESVVASSAASEFFYFTHNPDGKNPIAAVNATNGSYIGPPGLLPGATFVPASPGDFLTLFFTGGGSTDPAFVPGELPGSAGNVTGSVGVMVAGTQLSPADILYAGVSPGFAGLYQLNIRVPAGTPSGNQALILTINGLPSPAGYLFIGP